MEPIPRRLSSLLVLPLALFGAASQAQTPAAESLRWFQERCGPFSKEVAAEIRKGLAAEDRTVLDSIELKCLFNLGFGAAAVREGGRRLIVIPAGTLAILESTATASAIGSAYGKSLCGPMYMEALVRAARRNYAAMLNNVDPEPMLTPFEFARDMPEYCPSVTEAEFRANVAAAELRELLINGGLRFILAHELGHHVLGHPGTRPSSAEESRRRERDADSFALKTVGKAGQTPLEAVLALSLLAAYDDFGARDPKSASHPSGAERLASLRFSMQELRNDAAFQSWLNADPDRKQRWEMGVRAFTQMAKEIEQ